MSQFGSFWSCDRTCGNSRRFCEFVKESSLSIYKSSAHGKYQLHMSPAEWWGTEHWTYKMDTDKAEPIEKQQQQNLIGDKSARMSDEHVENFCGVPEIRLHNQIFWLAF